MASLRRQMIAQSFGSAEGYDGHSFVQRQVAAKLAAYIVDGTGEAPPPRCILEVGCGTGHLSEALGRAYPEATLLFSDLAVAMVARCRARLMPLGLRGANFLALDGENLPLGYDGFDLIASAMAFQWFQNLGPSLCALTHRLAPGGRLVFATIGADTFLEWQQAHAQLGYDSGLVPCPTLTGLNAQLKTWLPRGVHWDIAEERIVAEHPDSRDFLHGLKAIGATVPRSHHQPLSVGQLRAVMRALDTASPGAVHITHHILYASIVKEQN